MAKKNVEMIEVAVVTKFKDKENGKKLREVGEVFEITKERFDEIVEAGKKAGVEYIAVHEPEVEEPEAEEPETAEDGE
ncbi:MAG: hypothetical protein IJW29_06465 [Clostridia bacterium]|nr:hypothetical protein [Clostridia bacterium]MBQ9785126.1 hypothetical protein [Clostridia bacterium]